MTEPVRHKTTILFLPVLLALSLLALSCRQPALEYVKYDSDAGVPRISVEDAKKDLDAGTAVIVDSRDANSYALEHVAGAINIPAGSQDTEAAKLPQGKKIIVYCS